MQLDDPQLIALRERFNAMLRRKAKALGVYESAAPYFWRWLNATAKLTAYERSRVRFAAHVERVEARALYVLPVRVDIAKSILGVKDVA